jgi:GNAT superfamily N-acetyltransferase
MTEALMALPTRSLTLAGQSLVLRPLEADKPHDMQALLALHNAVFGSTVDQAWFDWKYRAGRSVGFGLWQDHELLAHCGGIPRRFWQGGECSQHLQIGDVMVRPDWRGILTRENPFALVSQAMYRHMLGQRKPYRVGFGFPNDRHMRLVVKTGLAWHVGDMTQLHWVGSPGRSALGWSWRLDELPHPDEAVIAHAWQAMQKDMRQQDLCAGERDEAHVRWRYLTRPDKHYRLMALRRAWSRKVVGVLVLSQALPVQWLDWIGPTHLMPQACLAARIAAQEAGTPELTAWCSPRVVHALKDTGVSSSEKVAAIGVPVTSDFHDAHGDGLPWWLMGGDTDFL